MPTSRQIFRFTKSIVKDICPMSALFSAVLGILYIVFRYGGGKGGSSPDSPLTNPQVCHYTGILLLGVLSIFILTVIYFIIDALYVYFTQKWGTAKMTELMQIRSIPDRIKSESKESQVKKEPKHPSRYDLIVVNSNIPQSKKDDDIPFGKHIREAIKIIKERKS